MIAVRIEQVPGPRDVLGQVVEVGPRGVDADVGEGSVQLEPGHPVGALVVKWSGPRPGLVELADPRGRREPEAVELGSSAPLHADQVDGQRGVGPWSGGEADPHRARRSTDLVRRCRQSGHAEAGGTADNGADQRQLLEQDVVESFVGRISCVDWAA
jgi:hypothetical protein